MINFTLFYFLALQCFLQLLHVQSQADLISRFTGIADVPYDTAQTEVLRNQILYQVPADNDFLIHLGDMRSGGGKCRNSKFQTVADILKTSPIPVFAICQFNSISKYSKICQEGYFFIVVLKCFLLFLFLTSTFAWSLVRYSGRQ